jgi:hypothetical protein
MTEVRTHPVGRSTKSAAESAEKPSIIGLTRGSRKLSTGWVATSAIGGKVGVAQNLRRERSLSSRPAALVHRWVAATRARSAQAGPSADVGRHTRQSSWIDHDTGTPARSIERTRRRWRASVRAAAQRAAGIGKRSGGRHAVEGEWSGLYPAARTRDPLRECPPAPAAPKPPP